MRKIFFLIIILLSFGVADNLSRNTITFQGRLISSTGAPANGVRYMKFLIFDAATGGNRIFCYPGASNDTTGVPVVCNDGNYAVELPFDDAQLSALSNTDSAYLELYISGESANTIDLNKDKLLPRVHFTGNAYALSARKVQGWTIDHATGQVTINGSVKSVANGVEFYMVPKGAIIMWSGAIANIPAGWALCDGTKGTPDLRSRFIVGAGSGYAVGATGGEATHVLTVAEMPAHNHGGATGAAGAHSHDFSMSYAYVNHQTTNAPTVYYSGSPNLAWTTSTAPDHTHTISSEGGGQPHENRPPYYALAFIMKL